MRLTKDQIKKYLGSFAAELVKNNMRIGLGTGTTVFYLIEELARKAKLGLKFSIVPTSKQTETLARNHGLKIISLEDISKPLDLTIDGADELDHQGNLIKGGGGALLQEKIVAAASSQLCIIADSGKKVKRLGRFPLPVEVIPFGHSQVIKRIRTELSCDRVVVRKKKNVPFVTDHQHFILDCYFKEIKDPSKLNEQLHLIPGVVETGLFVNMTNSWIVGHPDGFIEHIVLRKS